MRAARLSREDVLTQFRRTALLEAARRVFGARGFERATMDAIAAEADVAKGTVYLYYTSKQAIYDAAFQDCLDELDRRNAEGVAKAGTVREAVAAFIAVRTHYFQDHPDFFRMYVAEVTGQIVRQHPGRRGRRSLLDHQTRVLQDRLAAAVTRGEIRKIDPAATARAIVDMARGLVARRLFETPRAHVDHETDVCIDLLWNGITVRRGQKS